MPHQERQQRDEEAADEADMAPREGVERTAEVGASGSRADETSEAADVDKASIEAVHDSESERDEPERSDPELERSDSALEQQRDGGKLEGAEEVPPPVSSLPQTNSNPPSWSAFFSILRSQSREEGSLGHDSLPIFFKKEQSWHGRVLKNFSHTWQPLIPEMQKSLKKVCMLTNACSEAMVCLSRKQATSREQEPWKPRPLPPLPEVGAIERPASAVDAASVQLLPSDLSVQSLRCAAASLP